MTTTAKNKYGPTDPLNRDSDNDGAIDGGESNIYPDTPIDIDGDGVSDSGKTVDLNGDGIIEMGEENYYETPPGEVTYFLDIFAVADQEYRDYYNRWWDKDNYKNWINRSVDGASVYFMDEFDIKLKVVEISEDVWNSDDALDTHDIYRLLEDGMTEYHWINDKKGMDTLMAFTGKDPNYEGVASKVNKTVVVQIPEISDPQINSYVVGIKLLGKWPNIPDDITNYGVQYYWDSYLIQHEVSHVFGAHDYGPYPKREKDEITGDKLARIYSIMDKTKPSEDFDGFYDEHWGNIYFTHKWNPESIQIINSSKIDMTNGGFSQIE
jgi:hypothetical protein